MRYRIDIETTYHGQDVVVWKYLPNDESEVLYSGFRETISEAIAWAAEVIRREEER